MALFSHLIISLVVDLELHKPTVEEASHIFGVEYETRHHEMMEVPVNRTIEQRRLVLACYLLTSTYVNTPFQRLSCMNKANFQDYSLSSSHKKLEGVVWCPYLDQCLSKLEERKDPSDELLISQVRLQRVVHNAVEAYIQMIRDGKPSLPGNSTIIMLYIQTLKSQLAEVKNKIPSHLAENSMYPFIVGSFPPKFYANFSKER